MAAKKKTSATAAKLPEPQETFSDQIVVRVKPSTRAKLDAYVEKSGGRVRGVGHAVRHILETAKWS